MTIYGSTVQKIRLDLSGLQRHRYFNPIVRSIDCHGTNDVVDDDALHAYLVSQLKKGAVRFDDRLLLV